MELYLMSSVDRNVVYMFENLFHAMVRDIFSLYIDSVETGTTGCPDILHVLLMYFPAYWVLEALSHRHEPRHLDVSYQATQLVLRYNNSIQYFVMENSFERMCNLVGEVLEIFFKELTEAMVWHNENIRHLKIKHFILAVTYEPSLQDILSRRNFVPIPRISRRDQPFLKINIPGLQLTCHAHEMLENYLQKVYYLFRVCLLERCKTMKQTFMPNDVVLITKNMVKQLNSRVFEYKV